MEAPLLSVVVPSYGARSTIERCLTALLHEAGALPMEIIVVDSGDDGVPAFVKERFPKVKLVALDQRALPGRARNQGARVASAEHLAFVDADCVVEPGWGALAWRSIAAGQPITGGAVLPARPASVLGVVGSLAEFAEFLPGPSRAASFAPSCNLLVERKLFESVGGFPEDMRSGEDLVFCARCCDVVGEGALLFDGGRALRHQPHESWRGLLTHLVDVGRGSAVARARVPSLPGAFSVGRPLLAPLLVGWRLFRIGVHAARAKPPLWLVLAAAFTPLLFVCLCAWARGFCGADVRA